jgi:hypothetical protein
VRSHIKSFEKAFTHAEVVALADRTLKRFGGDKNKAGRYARSMEDRYESAKWAQVVEVLATGGRQHATKSASQLQREINETLAGRSHATKIGTSPAGVEWVAYRPQDVGPMTARLAALRAKADSSREVAKPGTLRHLYVLTIRDRKGTKLAELTGHRDARGNAVMRVWNASQRKWQKGTHVADFAHGYYVDERPAREADLKRYGFTLPAGHHLAS